MSEAAQILVGKHDFSAFNANDKVGKRSPVKEITRISISEEGSKIFFDVEGTGFLYKMVRTIVGTLLEVGKGKLSVSDVQEILDSKDIRKAGPTAPAKGLCLWKVEY